MTNAQRIAQFLDAKIVEIRMLGQYKLARLHGQILAVLRLIYGTCSVALAKAVAQRIYMSAKGYI